MTDSNPTYKRRRFLVGLGFAGVTALAGCSGGGNGDGDDNGDDGGDGGGGNGTDDGNGGGGGSSEWEPFRFEEPGTFTYEITQQGGEDGTLVWAIESVEDGSATVSADLDLGGFTDEVTASGTPSEIRQEVLSSPAGAFLASTFFAAPIVQSGGRSFTVGNEWSVTSGGQTATMKVTGTDSRAGLSCTAWEYALDGSTLLEGCVSTEHGVAVYVENYDESGTSTFRMELTDYASG